jgi:hypothetical protein
VVSEEVLVAVVGAVCLAAGWLAGRNRHQAAALTAYENLVKDLRTEIERLRAEVLELRDLLSVRSTRTRKS